MCLLPASALNCALATTGIHWFIIVMAGGVEGGGGGCFVDGMVVDNTVCTQ